MQLADADRNLLGFGLYSPRSQIRVRLWTFGDAQPDAGALLKERLMAARQRRTLLMADTDAVRYVNSEGDFLPGVILDKYAGVLVLQLLTDGVDKIRDEIVAAIRSTFNEAVLFEKSTGRTEEDLPDRIGILYGELPDSPVQIRDGDVRLWVDIHHGHKTGCYLDQRSNGRFLKDFFFRIREALPDTAHLLDCFSYSGSFGVRLKGLFGKVTFVDSSEEALRLCEKNLEDNSPAGSVEYICQDAFRYLRQPSIGPFDAVVLDPPSFARRKSEVDGACRGYKDVQRLAMKAIHPGGHLACFSCSQHIDADLFQKISFAAALDAGRQAQILARFGADLDHPASIDHPEGHYLKGLLLRVL